MQPFGSGATTLREQAPEVRCKGPELVGATMSDHGHVILAMFFDAPEGVQATSSDDMVAMCSQRAAAGYNSGMGLIFRRVAEISPFDDAGPRFAPAPLRWSRLRRHGGPFFP